LITASQVLLDAGKDHVAALVTNRQGGLVVVDLTSAHQPYGLDWVRDPDQGIAASLMPLVPEWNIKAVDEWFCAPLEEVSPSMPCFTFGRPYGLSNFDLAWDAPLVFDGVISGVNPTTRRFYVSAPTLPSNVGGPILVVRTPLDLGGSGPAEEPMTLLAGIVREVAFVPSGDEKQPFSLPLQIGVGVTIKAAIELVNSEAAQQQIERLPSTK
jgi:hypothetical protein